MTDSKQTLTQRVERLESEVSRLHEELQLLRENPEEDGPPYASLDQASPNQAGARPEEKQEFQVRDWIDKVGIGLLLIGVLFFLKYSYDQGWLTESARVMVGTGVGVALLAIGTWLRDSKRHLSAVLTGGAIATFYGVIYTTHALYELISFPVAFGLMQAVTVAGCLLAIRQHHAVLGSLVAIGAFATPFALHETQTGPVLLAIYAVIVSLGLITVYFLRGWRNVLLTTSVGAWAVLFVAQLELSSSEVFDKGIVVAAIAIVAVAMMAVPAVATRFQQRSFGEFEALHTILSVLAAMILIHEVLDPHRLMLLSVLVALGLVSYGLSHISWQKNHHASRALRASFYGLAALALALLMQINFYAQVLLVVGVTANFLARSDTGVARVVGVLAMGMLGFWCLILRVESVDGIPFLNSSGLLLIFATAGLLLVGRTFENNKFQWSHYWASLVAGLSIIIHQLQDLAHGAMISTCVWGAMALIMLVYGMLKEHRMIQLMGLFTIVATAGKLLIFDLDSVAVVWRMALFMGIGIAMLVLSALSVSSTKDSE